MGNSEHREHRTSRRTGTVASVEPPDFLTLPSRDEKPRRRGITHVLDKGVPIPTLESILTTQGHLVDYLKIGWGTAYVDPTIKERVALCSEAGVAVCLGGTLFEVCVAQGKTTELCRWAEHIGVGILEVSNGLRLLTRREKTDLIRDLSADFTILAETGAKSGDLPVVTQDWVSELESDLETGASLVIAEGRESGTVGLYHTDGTVRSELVEAISAGIPHERIIFEAPRKSQQAWLICRFGTHVNIGNVPPDDVLPLETSRIGLRADTAVPLSVRADRGR